MNTYLIVNNNTKVLIPSFIKGSTGIAALEEKMPVHFIGRIKRIRAWEEPDYILRKITKNFGNSSEGPAIGYKYHKPTITRE